MSIGWAGRSSRSRGFRTGVIEGDREVETNYGRPVSFGIRRCEFDDYLLKRSGARLKLGVPFSRLRREGRDWIVNEQIRTPLLVGAGGHFCPVARHLNGPLAGRRDRAGRGAGGRVSSRSARRSSFTTDPEKPELYFSRDLRGYGWCFRKQDHLNVGFGHLSRRALPKASADFVAFLAARAQGSDRCNVALAGARLLVARITPASLRRRSHARRRCRRSRVSSEWRRDPAGDRVGLAGRFVNPAGGRTARGGPARLVPSACCRSDSGVVRPRRRWRDCCRPISLPDARARSASYPGIRSARRARSVVFAFPRSGAQKRTRMWRSALALRASARQES